MMSVAALASAKASSSKYDDDAVQNAFDEVDGVAIGLTMGMLVCGMICNAVALYGASNFNHVAIAIGGIWFVFEFVRSIAFFNPLGAILAGFFCYPHAVFYYEIKNGVMSRENYPREKNCCDCC
jgi:hypothetical protein